MRPLEEIVSKMKYGTLAPTLSKGDKTRKRKP